MPSPIQAGFESSLLAISVGQTADYRRSNPDESSMHIHEHTEAWNQPRTPELFELFIDRIAKGEGGAKGELGIRIINDVLEPLARRGDRALAQHFFEKTLAKLVDSRTKGVALGLTAFANGLGAYSGLGYVSIIDGMLKRAHEPDYDVKFDQFLAQRLVGNLLTSTFDETVTRWMNTLVLNGKIDADLWQMLGSMSHETWLSKQPSGVNWMYALTLPTSVRSEILQRPLTREELIHLTTKFLETPNVYRKSEYLFELTLSRIAASDLASLNSEGQQLVFHAFETGYPRQTQVLHRILSNPAAIALPSYDAWIKHFIKCLQWRSLALSQRFFSQEPILSDERWGEWVSLFIKESGWPSEDSDKLELVATMIERDHPLGPQLARLKCETLLKRGSK